ncbi:MAG: GNAT family N-acetyltransferase [Burkholderiales bacterium]|nr:GNAT family N-acetyltransferase [Burkholderiales bacterium]
MSGIHLRPVAAADAAALLRFELEHRAYFERWVQARDPAFYSADGVAAAIAAAETARAAGQAFQYLVVEGQRIVGRVNLTHVQRAHFHCADLGYRIGEQDGGRGIASRAVALCLERAFGEHGLLRIEATARPVNLGSIRVLERNGFRRFGHSRRSVELGGQWHDRLLFERHRDEPPAA